VYHIDDRGPLVRLWYFLPTDSPTVEDFLSLQERKRREGKAFVVNPIATRWAEGVSTWATEALGRVQGTAPRINRGRWKYIAGLNVATDGKEIQIERTGGNAGHFTVFAEPSILLDCIREIKRL
jgi:hypothetical protein